MNPTRRIVLSDDVMVIAQTAKLRTVLEAMGDGAKVLSPEETAQILDSASNTEAQIDAPSEDAVLDQSTTILGGGARMKRSLLAVAAVATLTIQAPAYDPMPTISGVSPTKGRKSKKKFPVTKTALPKQPPRPLPRILKRRMG